MKQMERRLLVGRSGIAVSGCSFGKSSGPTQAPVLAKDKRSAVHVCSCTTQNAAQQQPPGCLLDQDLLVDVVNLPQQANHVGLRLQGLAARRTGRLQQGA